MNAPERDRPLKIGLSPRFLHKVPDELGFKGKKLQYLEQSIAHWLMTADALVFMLPSMVQFSFVNWYNILDNPIGIDNYMRELRRFVYEDRVVFYLVKPAL